MKDKAKLTHDLKNIVGNKYVLTSKLNKEPFSKGWRYGNGEAFAVIKPGTLVEMWHVIEVCVNENLIMIMQAANTGLTGGSTPFGNDYDRPIIIINTMRINNINVINDGNQIIGLAGSTLYDLEKKLIFYQSYFDVYPLQRKY